MAAPQLTTAESATLAQAVDAARAGDAARAAELLSPMLSRGNRHPDVLLTFSAACEQLGRFPNAVGAAKAAIEQAPERADLWAHYGRMLHDGGNSVDGANFLERAVVLDSANPQFWYNLGVAVFAAGWLPRSIEALQKAVELQPANAPAWGALGLALQRSGALDESEASLRKAIELDPRLLSAAHNLAITLRRLDRPEDALTAVDAAMRAGLSAVETRTVRAHLLADLSRYDEAVQTYRTLIAEAPGAIDAQETLARLLPQLGRGDEAMTSYDEALKRAPTIELYRSALNSAWALKQPEALQRWAEDALRRFGEQSDLKMMQGLGHGLAGESDKALDVIEPLAASGFAPVLSQCAYYRLKIGDLKAAESHALAATQASATDQAAWAYLTVIWRLLGDSREAWLADYERFVMPIMLEAPEGHSDIAAFMGMVAAELNELHKTLEHPADQSLRQGTQTRGNLFNKRSPVIRQLASAIEQAIAAATASLPTDPTHPFLSRRSGRTRFLGSWSVRLRGGGFHVSHIHQEGWLSSALYAELPPEVESAPREGAPPGSLTFGVPDRELGLDLEPRRVEIPEVGQLVLFPSYFWHGTMPFDSEQHRLTVAFDAEPV